LTGSYLVLFFPDRSATSCLAICCCWFYIFKDTKYKDINFSASVLRRSAGFACMDAGEGRVQERKLRLLCKQSLHSKHQELLLGYLIKNNNYKNYYVINNT
jgi:hypothetical protein